MFHTFYEFIIGEVFDKVGNLVPGDGEIFNDAVFPNLKASDCILQLVSGRSVCVVTIVM